ncbi:MAG TPA: metallophosphoesterase [Roseiarcus sp.]|nr:metallophosphoesterase [Roseiarcus sp.]
MLSWLRTLVRREQTYPPAPEGVALYAIGDIHGRSDCLAAAHALIDRDIGRLGNRDRAVEIYLGDYVDRGPDSKGVIDRLIERASTTPMVLLKGNHEIVMESFLRGLTPFENWRKLGGLETILSYGVDARARLARGGTISRRDLAERLPLSHMRFIAGLETLRRFGPYCFVHAGLRPGVPAEKQSVEDLVWIREDFLNFAGDFGCVVVHGHTPVDAIEFLPNRVNIDTGAYATNRLSIVRIDAKGLSVVEDAPK